MNSLSLPLFTGLDEASFERMKALSFMKEQDFSKGSYIFHMGDTTHRLGIVLSGGVIITSTDLWGNRSVLNIVGPDEIFGETYALTGQMLMVDAQATEDTRILLVDVKPIMDPGYSEEPWQRQVLANLLRLCAGKNLILSARIFHTSPKKIRSRLMSYLSACSIRAASKEFDIPFDRQELADYLNLDRSALSKELGHMRDEGILEYRKNHFILHEAGL